MSQVQAARMSPSMNKGFCLKSLVMSQVRPARSSLIGPLMSKGLLGCGWGFKVGALQYGAVMFLPRDSLEFNRSSLVQMLLVHKFQA